MSILSFDVGRKKIGVAYSENELLAEEFCTLKYQKINQVISEISFLILRKEVDKIIIGIPQRSDGTDSSETLHVREFSKKLEEQILQNSKKIEIFFEDESLTSKEAERILFNQGKSLDEVRERRDQLAAKLILDQYLNR